MSERSVGTTFPRWFLIGISTLLLTTLVSVGLVQWTGVGASRVSDTPAVASVDIWFDPQNDGTMLVRRASDGDTLEVLPSDGGGFMRGVARSLLRQRALSNSDKALPFTLSQREDQRYFILDTKLGTKMELDGFGPSNTQSVGRVLKAGLATAKSLDKQSLLNPNKLDETSTAAVWINRGSK